VTLNILATTSRLAQELAVLVTANGNTVFAAHLLTRKTVCALNEKSNEGDQENSQNGGLGHFFVSEEGDVCLVV
jgi:hypothetical protein